LEFISRGQRIPLKLKAGEQKILNKHPLPKQAGAYSINGWMRVLRRVGWGGGEAHFQPRKPALLFINKPV